MRFYEVNYPSVLPPDGADYPCVVLTTDNWNDFGYYTTWKVTIYGAKAELVMQNSVKILQMDPEIVGTEKSTTTIPSSFEQLSAEYCSLGQSLEYYEKLRNAGSEIYSPYFIALRDVAIYPAYGAQLVDTEGFRKSLLRFSEAEKAFNEARSLFTSEPASRSFTFSFQCKVPGAERPHKVDFDFSEHPTRLHRTTVLIGRNGTGKTQFLAQFALSMSGLRESSSDGGEFVPSRPSFSRVIAVSYSVFDDFKRPPENNRTFSYKYCGVRAPDADPASEMSVVAGSPVAQESRFLSPSEIRRRLENTLQELRTQEREGRWKDILAILLEGTVELDEQVFEDIAFYDRLSSGQRILVAIMTEIVAHISKQSIILFDEPELHLHPEVFAALARAFDHLLNEFDSYAIIATHSSLLLQETLSRQVRVFRRIGNFPTVEPLMLESFGENLSSITREVFSVDSAQNNFRAHLDKLSEHRTPEQVESLFPLGLPLQAQAYLRAKAREEGQ